MHDLFFGEAWSRVSVWVQESLKATVDGQQLNLDTQDLGTGSKTLGKAAARYVRVRALAITAPTAANRRSISILSVCHSCCCNRESLVAGSGHFVLVCKPLTLLIFSAIQQVVCYHLSRLKNCTLTNLSLTFPVGSPNVTTTVCVHVRESCDITKMYFRLPLSAVSFWAYSVRTRTFTY